MSDEKSDEKKAAPAQGPDQPAAKIASSTIGDQPGELLEEETDERLPAAPGTAFDPVVVGERRGMYGAADLGDTSGYGGLDSPVLFPAASQRPYGSYFDDIADNLERGLVGGAASFGEAVERVVVDRGELTLFVRREHLPAVARVLRDDPALRFEMCTGVSGVHYPAETGRELHAVYHFLSITHGGRRVRVEVTCPDGDAHIPSIVSIYPANDWHERETRARRAASCTRCTTCSRSRTAAAGCASRSPPRMPTRTSRRSCRSTRATTGTSARPGTCSASSSTGTPPSPGS